MSKVVQALLSGMFFTFLLDFFLFLGIFQNYIRVYEIDLYYNILFADNQSMILFALFTIILGYLSIYQNAKLAIIVIGTLSIFSLATLITPIGNTLGEVMLMKKNGNARVAVLSNCLLVTYATDALLSTSSSVFIVSSVSSATFFPASYSF